MVVGGWYPIFPLSTSDLSHSPLLLGWTTSSPALLPWYIFINICSGLGATLASFISLLTLQLLSVLVTKTINISPLVYNASCHVRRTVAGVNICSGLRTALASIMKTWLNYASCPVWSIVLEVKFCLRGVGTTLARFIPGSFNFWAWLHCTSCPIWSNGINIWCALTSSGWSLNYFSIWSIDRVFDFNIRSFLLCILCISSIASFKSPSKDPPTFIFELLLDYIQNSSRI